MSGIRVIVGASEADVTKRGALGGVEESKKAVFVHVLKIDLTPAKESRDLNFFFSFLFNSISFNLLTGQMLTVFTL